MIRATGDFAHVDPRTGRLTAEGRRVTALNDAAISKAKGEPQNVSELLERNGKLRAERNASLKRSWTGKKRENGKIVGTGSQPLPADVGAKLRSRAAQLIASGHKAGDAIKQARKEIVGFCRAYNATRTTVPAMQSRVARNLPRMRHGLIMLSADAGDGHWVTIDGTHVYIGKGGEITKGPAALVGKKPEHIDEHHREHTDPAKPPEKSASEVDDTDFDKAVYAGGIEPPHEVRESKKYNSIADSMAENGWQGRPILAEEAGDGFLAWTGSHRVAAAQKTRTDVPVAIIDREAIRKFLADEGEDESMTLKEYAERNNISDDDDRLRLMTQIGDKRAEKLLRAEIAANS